MMAAKKTPNYDEMDLDGLEAAAAEHYGAIRELRESGESGLDVELKVAEHQAHLRIINPLRTDAKVTAELARSQMARKLAGLSEGEWQRLRQVVNAPEAIADGVVHEPGASKG